MWLQAVICLTYVWVKGICLHCLLLLAHLQQSANLLVLSQPCLENKCCVWSLSPDWMAWERKTGRDPEKLLFTTASTITNKTTEINVSLEENVLLSMSFSWLQPFLKGRGGCVELRHWASMGMFWKESSLWAEGVRFHIAHLRSAVHFGRDACKKKVVVLVSSFCSKYLQAFHLPPMERELLKA